MPIRKQALFDTLPSEWPVSMLPLIQSHVQRGAKLVVLDDDPTGTQTVHDVPVLTRWDVSALAEELKLMGSVMYVLTNSRSVSPAQARAINCEIAANLRAASAATGRAFAIVSRSDSTLRGHYAEETEALIEALGEPVDGILVVPFFLEGGRYTIGDVHYVDEGNTLTPAAETEFARDPAFGYSASDLRQWVADKSGGAWSAGDVASISLEDLRVTGPRKVEILLSALADARPCVVNAVSYRDLEVLVAGLLASEAQGRRYLYRTASSFVRVRGGLDQAPLLTAADFSSPEGTGGLVIAGSFVHRTTAQIEAAGQAPGVVPLELSVPALLGADAAGEIARVRAAATAAMLAGRDALVYTSRGRVEPEAGADALSIGQRISSGLVDLVRGIKQRPAWIVAKGGITSSDIATEALGVRRAWVRGQAIPGVPVWRTGAESRWPGMDYVVFPGNVGGPGALAEMITLLHGTCG